LTYPVNRFIFY